MSRPVSHRPTTSASSTAWAGSWSLSPCYRTPKRKSYSAVLSLHQLLSLTIIIAINNIFNLQIFGTPPRTEHPPKMTQRPPRKKTPCIHVCLVEVLVFLFFIHPFLIIFIFPQLLIAVKSQGVCKVVIIKVTHFVIECKCTNVMTWCSFSLKIKDYIMSFLQNGVFMLLNSVSLKEFRVVRYSIRVPALSLSTGYGISYILPMSLWVLSKSMLIRGLVTWCEYVCIVSCDSCCAVSVPEPLGPWPGQSDYWRRLYDWIVSLAWRVYILYFLPSIWIQPVELSLYHVF